MNCLTSLYYNCVAGGRIPFRGQFMYFFILKPTVQYNKKKGSNIMASVNIRAMIAKKQEEKMKSSHLVMKDVNRDLIVALLALPVYGKEARDDEILTIIINGGVESTYLDKIRDNFNSRVEKHEIKKVKGEYRDADGFLVLVPRA